MLIEGIIILVIGIILFALQNALPPGGKKAAAIGGAILIIIGIILIVLGVIGVAFLSLGALYPSLAPLLHN
jgi:hypothetical protein